MDARNVAGTSFAVLWITVEIFSLFLAASNSESGSIKFPVTFFFFPVTQYHVVTDIADVAVRITGNLTVRCMLPRSLIKSKRTVTRDNCPEHLPQKTSIAPLSSYS